MKNIETPSYGKGYVIADLEWQRLIRGVTALRDKHGMTIVLVAHSTIERIDDPRAPTYTSYLPKLHKRARHLILDACDIVGFLAEDLRVITDDGGFRERTRAAGTNARQLFLEGTPAFAAKNRFGMPAKMPIRWTSTSPNSPPFGQSRKHRTMSTQLDQAFDVEKEEGSSFDTVPPGKYAADLMQAEVVSLKSGRGQAVAMRWCVYDGEHEGRWLFATSSFSMIAPRRRNSADGVQGYLCRFRDHIADHRR